MDPQRYPHPVSRKSLGKRDLEDGIKLKRLIWGNYPGLFKLTLYNHMDPYNRKTGKIKVKEGNTIMRTLVEVI